MALECDIIFRTANAEEKANLEKSIGFLVLNVCGSQGLRVGAAEEEEIDATAHIHGARACVIVGVALHRFVRQPCQLRRAQPAIHTFKGLR